MFYFILIFGFISNKFEPDMVFDLFYNYEYNLLKDIIRYNFTEYDFRMPIYPGDRIDIESKILKNEIESSSFDVKVYEYNYYPTAQNIILHEGTESPLLGPYKSYNESNFTFYSFTFQASENGKYFGIYFKPDSINYSYIKIRTNLSRYKYSFIKDITFNEYDIFNTSIFINKIFPLSYEIFYRLSVISTDKFTIQLETHEKYDKNNSFRVDICKYDRKPDESQVYHGNSAAKKCDIDLINISGEDKIFKYIGEV